MKITKKWLIDTAERTAWTFVQAAAGTFLVVIGTATAGVDLPGITEVPWKSALSIGATSGFLAVVKAMVRQTKATPPEK